MRRLIILFALGTVLAGFSGATVVWAKAHVPVHKAQVCHNGRLIVVSDRAVKAHVRHGDCQLPACDFNNVSQKKDSCSGDAVEGLCVLPNPRDDAGGVTNACPVGKL